MDKSTVLAAFARYEAERDPEKKAKLFRRTCRNLADQLGVPYINRSGSYLFPTFTLTRDDSGRVSYIEGSNDLADIDTSPKTKKERSGDSTPRKSKAKITDVNLDQFIEALRAALIEAGYEDLGDPGYNHYYWALQLHMIASVYSPAEAVKVIDDSATARSFESKSFAIDRGLLMMGPVAKANASR